MILKSPEKVHTIRRENLKKRRKKSSKIHENIQNCAEKCLNNR